MLFTAVRSFGVAAARAFFVLTVRLLLVAFVALVLLLGLLPIVCDMN
ncbi:hypothetical protein U370_04540 [Anaplasma marginale str. Dawn]|nr:hypothetical protein U370_04540 [Anaplasma marginale str. Dawn]